MTVSIDRDDDIAIVTVDNPPVNALGQALRQGLWDAVGRLDADASVRAVVLVCAGRTFIAGADVTEFGKRPVPPHLPDLVDRIEGAAKPWVAAIHGSALGGGFEVAMGCRFRVALDSASVGLPEVTLGIVPGASGTVRTPRLAGVAAAVELITSGRPVRAAKALSLGLVDAVVTGDLRAEAVAFARAALERPLPSPVSARPVTSPDAGWWDAQRAAIATRAKGEVAPLHALDCLRIAAERPFAEALAHERATFLALRASDQAAALRHIFFAERAAPRPSHLPDAKPRPLRREAVIGGGAMAAGINAALRDAGLSVVPIEGDDVAVMQAGGDMAALADADIVIEAVAEDLSAKRAVFGLLGQACRADAVLATTTAQLDPRLIAQGLPSPDRFIGLHFMGHAKATALVEIVPTPDTAPDVLVTGFALTRSLGAIPVQAGIIQGFIGTRILNRYHAEAEALLRQGISAASVDQAMRAYGFAKGPFEAQEMHDPAGDRMPPPSPAVPDAAHISARLVAAMAEEGRAILAQGIALKPSDIDLVVVHGCGFPRWRGGPMFAAALGAGASA